LSNATPDAMRTTLADLGFDYALEADPGDEWVRPYAVVAQGVVAAERGL
jgi:hypothetical protein